MEKITEVKYTTSKGFSGKFIANPKKKELYTDSPMGRLFVECVTDSGAGLGKTTIKFKDCDTELLKALHNATVKGCELWTLSDDDLHAGKIRDDCFGSAFYIDFEKGIHGVYKYIKKRIIDS